MEREREVGGEGERYNKMYRDIGTAIGTMRKRDITIQILEDVNQTQCFTESQQHVLVYTRHVLPQSTDTILRWSERQD